MFAVWEVLVKEKDRRGDLGDDLMIVLRKLPCFVLTVTLSASVHKRLQCISLKVKFYVQNPRTHNSISKLVNRL